MLADALQLDVQPILAAGPQPVVVPAAVTVFQTQVELYRQLQMMHALDRKSTRLNSSHLVISYAVFCLKKKIRSVRCGWTFLRPLLSLHLQMSWSATSLLLPLRSTSRSPNHSSHSSSSHRRSLIDFTVP